MECLSVHSACIWCFSLPAAVQESGVLFKCLMFLGQFRCLVVRIRSCLIDSASMLEPYLFVSCYKYVCLMFILSRGFYQALCSFRLYMVRFLAWSSARKWVLSNRLMFLWVRIRSLPVKDSASMLEPYLFVSCYKVCMSDVYAVSGFLSGLGHSFFHLG